MTEMTEKIREILRDVQPAAKFEDGVDFVAEGYLDSFDVITLVSELEDNFGIIISALDILPENFSSAQTIAALVEKSEKRN